MANLIITIISIALVAVAAIMGAYYGGTAFLQSQTKAYANTSISQGEQLVDAWAVYAADHGGSYSISGLSVLSSTSPTYLSTVPQSPGTVTLASPGVNAWTIANLSDVSGGTSTGSGYNGVYYQLTNDNNGMNVCNYVAQAIGGSGLGTSAATNISISISTINNLLAASTGRKFDCVYTSATVSTGATASTPKYIYYRAF